ncbi:MAG: hypothetical protein DME20_02510 [Verrucomicrobia bacterium]|nr:MAG: hypothetical protein DME92_06035 [Verrucomicrobiota bacterium]PYJ63060.1 MAG: hypothetical protein DME74_04550 [Verrucomicrobiota bacterium]PYK51164.1 MAG: hypothetical protein DME20_02510 [Verrucomicrobiota bacterium]
MNPEVHKIIEHMQKLAPPAQVQVSDYDRVHTYQMLNMARLMVLLAEEQKRRLRNWSSLRLGSFLRPTG